MKSRRTLLAVAEVAAWWVPLAALWLVLVSTLDPSNWPWARAPRPWRRSSPGARGGR
ncbi:hypothetical protein [Streptomyces violaceorubidus]